MLKPGLNIIGEVHPFGFRAPIACKLDVGFADNMGDMPDIEGIFTVDDNSDAILDLDSIGTLELVAATTLLSGRALVIGLFIDIGSIGVIELADSGILPADEETTEGWLVDIGSIGDSGFDVSTRLLWSTESIVRPFINILGINGAGSRDLRIIVPDEEPLIGSFADISGIALVIDIFESFVDIPGIAGVDNVVVLLVTIPDIPELPVSSPRPTPACRMDSGRHSTFPRPFARILSTQNGNAPVSKYWE